VVKETKGYSLHTFR